MSTGETLYVRASHLLLTGFCFLKLANIYTLLERLKMMASQARHDRAFLL